MDEETGLPLIKVWDKGYTKNSSPQ